MFMVVVYCDGYIKCTTFDHGCYKVTVIVWYGNLNGACFSFYLGVGFVEKQ